MIGKGSDILRGIGGFARSHSLPAFVVAAIVAKQVAIVLQLGPELLWTGIILLLAATTGSVVVAATLLCRRAGRGQIWRLFLLDFILTAIAYGDLLHFRAFGGLTSVASLRFAGQLDTVRSSVIGLVDPYVDAWLTLDLLALAIWFAWPGAANIRAVSTRVSARFAVGGILLAICAALASPRGDSRYKGDAWLVGHMGLVNYHAWEIGSYVARLSSRLLPDDGAVNEAIENLEPAWRRKRENRTALFGAATGRNVIVVQLESFQGFAAGLEIDGQAVTPELDALAAESLHFPAFFNQAARGRTSDAQFVANCSLYPSRSGAVAFEYADNDLHCLPSALVDAGYETVFVQAHTPDFWNRAAFNPKQGFLRSLSERDFEIDEEIGLGLSDESFFRQTIEKLEEVPEPFYAFLLTLTSHAPFDFPELPRRLRLGSLEGTLVGDYLHTVHYTDRALGHFVDRLRESGMLERSVLVVYGDHDGATRRSSNLPDFLPIAAGDELGWVKEERRVPLLIRLPGGEGAGERTDVGGQVDLAPTLLGLLGMRSAGMPFLGTNLLAGDEPGRVYLPDGSVLTADRLLLSSDATLGAPRCFGPEGERPLDDCGELGRDAADELAISETILEKNLVPAIRKTWAGRVMGAK